METTGMPFARVSARGQGVKSESLHLFVLVQVLEIWPQENHYDSATKIYRKYFGYQKLYVFSYTEQLNQVVFIC